MHPTRPWAAVACAAALCAGVIPLRAQVSTPALSGTITDSAGAVLRSVAVSVRSIATGQTAETKTDSLGRYSVASLLPGDYLVVASATGFDTATAHVTIAAGVPQTVNLTLRAGLSLSDLGFTATETRGSAEAQARLDRRSHMLQIHQRLGLITALPLLATVITGALAGGRRPSTPDRTIHAVLGSVTAGLYLTSASFAIFAPKIHGTRAHGPIRLHKALAWIHGPGMILTPVLGAMAYDQRSRGERVHGIARAHGIAGIATAAAYGLSILTVSVKF